MIRLFPSKNLIIFEPGEGDTFDDIGAAMASAELFNRGINVRISDLKEMTPQDYVSLTEQIDKTLPSAEKATPLFPGFPHQVEEADPFALRVVQVVHYLNVGIPELGLPSHQEFIDALKLEHGERVSNPVILERSKFFTLSTVTPEGLVERLSSARSELSKDSLDMLNEFYNDSALDTALSRAGGQVVAQVAFTAHDKGDFDLARVVSRARNVNDILRLIYVNDGNYDTAVSLASPLPRLKVNVPRATRRAILNAVMRTTKTRNGRDSMYRNAQAWKDVFKGIHAGDYAKSTPGFDEVARAIYDNSYETLDSSIDKARREKDWIKAADLMAEKSPAELVKGISSLWRNSDEKQRSAIAATFRKTAAKVSVRGLVSAYNAISANGAGSILSVSGRQDFHLEREAMDEDAAAKLLTIVREALIDSIKRSGTDSIVVSSQNMEANVNLYERNSASTSVGLEPGTKIALPEGSERVRLFLHWFNDDDHWRGVDYDLGAIFVGPDGRIRSVIDYTSYYYTQDFGTFSGDHTTAPRPNGAVEFVDVSRENLLKRGVSRVVVTTVCYSGHALNSIEHATGVQAVGTSDGMDGDHAFVRENVLFSSTSNATGQWAAPFAYDVEENNVIWLDLSVSGRGVGMSTTGISDDILPAVNDLTDARRLTNEQFIEIAREAGWEITVDDSSDDAVSATDAVARIIDGKRP